MPKSSKPASRRLLRLLTVVAIAAGGTFALEQAGWLEPLENVYSIVAVDDDTLLQFKDEPLAFWAPLRQH